MKAALSANVSWKVSTATTNHKRDVRKLLKTFGVPYEIRTRVTAVKEATHCNSTELSGMDSTLPHLEDSRERLLDSYWTLAFIEYALLLWFSDNGF